MRNRQWLIGALGGLIATLGLIGLAIYWPREAREFRATALEATATVIDHSESFGRDAKGKQTISSFDVYEFRTHSGRNVRFSSHITGMHPSRELGAVATILYQPSQPQAARLDDDTAERAAEILFWCSPLGLLLALPFLLIWLRSRSVPGDSVVIER